MKRKEGNQKKSASTRNQNAVPNSINATATHDAVKIPATVIRRPLAYVEEVRQLAPFRPTTILYNTANTRDRLLKDTFSEAQMTPNHHRTRKVHIQASHVTTVNYVYCHGNRTTALFAVDVGRVVASPHTDAIIARTLDPVFVSTNTHCPPPDGLTKYPVYRSRV